MINMKTKQLFSMITLFAILFASCKKDKIESIDYNTLTGERILEISEKPAISDDDITVLETLLGQVTDNSLKTKYAGMIEGVKILKDVIPGLQTLRTDPDIIFQDKYAELTAQLERVTDQLPRKATLQGELEAALGNYNTEEYEFPDIVLRSGDGGGLSAFLANEFDVHPVEGKPTRYLRADIERVDSLYFRMHQNWAEPGIVPLLTRTFRGLRALNIATDQDPVLDLNHLTNLETLIVQYVDELKFDQLQGLKHIQLTGKWGETLDFTDKYPLLETLILPQSIVENLVTLLLPDKQHLTNLQLQGAYGQYIPEMLKAKRVVIEGKAIPSLTLYLGSETNREIDEVRLSGFGGELRETSPTSLTIGAGIRFDYTINKVKIKKLSLSNIDVQSVSLSGLDLVDPVDFSVFSDEKLNYALAIQYTNFSQKIDLTPLTFTGVTQFTFEDNTYAGTKFSYEDISSVFTAKTDPETLKTLQLIGLSGYPDKTLDLGRFTNLGRILFTSATSQDGQILEKLILNRNVQNTYRIAHRNEPGVAQPEVQIEFVD